MLLPFALTLFCLFNSVKAEIIKDLRTEKIWFQNGCDIYTLNRTVRKYPGSMCIFLDDGSFISSTDNSIRRFTPKKTVQWEIAGNFHHQMNLSLDKSSLLVLSSELVNSKSIERNDVFLRIGLDGKILGRKSAIEIMKEKKLWPLYWDNEPLLKVMKADVETSHFNSIYEIPENTHSRTVPYLKAGNVIVNSLSLGIFILSPDFEQTLYHKTFSFSQDHTVHDVQVDANGEFLFFNNDNLNNTKNRIYHSAIQRFDPVKDVISFEYTAKEKEHFFSPSCGGVQDFDNYLFISRLMSGGLLYSKSEKKVILGIPGAPSNPTQFRPTQQLKLIYPRLFFQKSMF